MSDRSRNATPLVVSTDEVEVAYVRAGADLIRVTTVRRPLPKRSRRERLLSKSMRLARKLKGPTRV